MVRPADNKHDASGFRETTNLQMASSSLRDLDFLAAGSAGADTRHPPDTSARVLLQVASSAARGSGSQVARSMLLHASWAALANVSQSSWQHSVSTHCRGDSWALACRSVYDLHASRPTSGDCLGGLALPARTALGQFAAHHGTAGHRGMASAPTKLVAE